MNRDERIRLIQECLDNPGGLSMSVKIHHVLNEAGAFDNRPTWEQIVECLCTPRGFVRQDAEVAANDLVDAGLVQPKREEPAFTEDEVMELARVLNDGYGTAKGTRYWDDAVKAFEAGYRKRTEGGNRDG